MAPSLPPLLYPSPLLALFSFPSPVGAPSHGAIPPPVIPDQIGDPGSLFFVGTGPRACPSLAPAGVAAPRSRNQLGGDDCLSEASSAALTFGTGAQAPEGPRPGANGFGSFCRNKRTSSCGGDTPKNPLSLFTPHLQARRHDPRDPEMCRTLVARPVFTRARRAPAAADSGAVQPDAASTPGFAFLDVAWVRCNNGDTCFFNIPNVHPLLGDKIRVRLARIDAPEVRTKCKAEKAAAYEARDMLAERLRHAKAIDLRGVARGKYFRLVAEVLADGENLSDLLLASGPGSAVRWRETRAPVLCWRVRSLLARRVPR